MKKILAGLLLLSSFSVLATDAEEIILAETTNSDNIVLNGKELNHCSVYAVEEKKENKNVYKLYLRVGAQDGRTSEQYLLTIPTLDLNSDRGEIKYSNGSSCLDRKKFSIKFANNSLREITSLSWSNGMCKTGQILLKIPATVFGSDTHGNDLHCDFQ